MSEWVSILLRWECEFAEPGPQRGRSSGAHGDCGSEYPPNNSSWLVGGEATSTGPQRCFRDGCGNTAPASRRKPLCGRRALVTSDYGGDVRVGLRGRRGASRNSSLATGMDGQPSSNGVPRVASIRCQRLCPRHLQRAGNSRHLDRILGSTSLPRGKAPLKQANYWLADCIDSTVPSGYKAHGIHGKMASL
jgi:hypothetical protein